MFPSNRQEQLNPIVQDLQAVPGVTNVKQDDFDSRSIRLFITLDDGNSKAGSINGHKPFRFTQPLRQTSAKIAAIFRKHKVNADVLDRPKLTYNSFNYRKYPDGYTTDRIMVDVYV